MYEILLDLSLRFYSRLGQMENDFYLAYLEKLSELLNIKPEVLILYLLFILLFVSIASAINTMVYLLGDRKYRGWNFLNMTTLVGMIYSAYMSCCNSKVSGKIELVIWIVSFLIWLVLMYRHQVDKSKIKIAK